MNDENRSNDHPEPSVSVPANALRQVLDLAEMCHDDRSEYLDSFHGRVDAALDDALDTLAAQWRAMGTLRDCLKRSDESGQSDPGADLDDGIEANSALHTAAPEDGFGYWDEDPDFPVQDWQYEVRNDDTRESYWNWVAKQREFAREEDANEPDSQVGIG